MSARLSTWADLRLFVNPPESLHASPSQQPPPHHDLIGPQPQGFPGDAGLSAAEPIAAKPAARQPIAPLARQRRAGAEGAAQLSLVQEERIGQQRPGGGQGPERGAHSER